MLSEKFGSKYLSIQSKINSRVSLKEELEKIKNGYYKLSVQACREKLEEDIKIYKKLKEKLPAITFSGVFNGPHNKESLIEYNNIIVIDIDNLQLEKLNEIKTMLFADQYVIACWISPSGRGIKLLVKIIGDSNLHKFYYHKVVDYIIAKYNVDIDTSGSDVNRLCFVSFDENLLIKKDADCFPLDEDEWLITLLNNENLKEVNALSSSSERQHEIYTKTEKILFYKTEGRNNAKNKELARKIIAYLTRTNQSITENYSTWLKVAFAVSNSFTFDVGKRIYLEICRLDKSAHDEYKSEKLLEYCYRKRKVDEVNFGSIIYLAGLKGFKKL